MNCENVFMEIMWLKPVEVEYYVTPHGDFEPVANVNNTLLYLNQFLLYNDDYFEAAFYQDAFSGFLVKRLKKNMIALAYYVIVEK